jgi:hypothetical protein
MVLRMKRALLISWRRSDLTMKYRVFLSLTPRSAEMTPPLHFCTLTGSAHDLIEDALGPVPSRLAPLELVHAPLYESGVNIGWQYPHLQLEWINSIHRLRRY